MAPFGTWCWASREEGGKVGTVTHLRAAHGGSGTICQASGTWTNLLLQLCDIYDNLDSNPSKKIKVLNIISPFKENRKQLINTTKLDGLGPVNNRPSTN